MLKWLCNVGTQEKKTLSQKDGGGGDGDKNQSENIGDRQRKRNKNKGQWMIIDEGMYKATYGQTHIINYCMFTGTDTHTKGPQNP